MNVGHDVNLTDTDSLNARLSAAERSRPTGEKRRGPPESGTGGSVERRAKSKFSVDPVSLIQPALRRWPLVCLGLFGGAGIALALALSTWRVTYSSTVQLVRYDPPVAEGTFRPHPTDAPTLIDRLGGDFGFLRRVGEQMNPKMTSGEVLSHMKVIPERNSAVMNIVATGSNPRVMTDLANKFAGETVKFTQDLQAQEATEAESYIDHELADAQSQLATAQKDMPTVGAGSSGNGGVSLTPEGQTDDKLAQKIQDAKDDLAKLLAKYTDAHPLVKQQRAMIAALEAESETGISAEKAAAAEQAKAKNAGSAADTTDGFPHRVVSRDEFEVALFRLRELENMQMQLQYRKQQIALFKANPPGGFRITVPASADTLSVRRPWIKIGLVTLLGAIVGLTLSIGQVLFREFIDCRLKTREDVTRVTGLPVIATLGDLRQMSMAAREDWAFRTWIALQDRLSFSPNHGLICGITSSQPGDGRSTWVGLLAGAARKCGFRVLTIATKPTADATVNAKETMEAEAAAVAAQEAARGTAANGRVVNGAKAESGGVATATKPAAATATMPPRANGAVVPRASEIESLRGVSADSEFTAMTASALFTPAQVTEKLMGPESDPLVHIPLPGWTWNLERRKQWQGALSVWRKIENVVILVELPPASVAEAVLLASNLPNILWLVESGKSEAAETRAQLQTLRHARCNLVGAVINRAMSTLTQGRLSRWMGCIMLLGTLGLCTAQLRAQAAPATTSGTATASDTGTFSVTSAAQRAEWQRHLTLGPGDVLTLSLYGDPDLTEKAVPIGPDGRISYLEANDVIAAGLTVDELRDKLNQALGKFRREPQVIVVPVEYKSKKYYILGKVAQRGVFTLDRPTTLLEAVARARGVETGIASDSSLIELADLSHSFVARNGRKLPVDFEKLFDEGDLSQNIALEPNDYIYFPAAELQEVYVLGAVERPGPYAYTSPIGALSAIAARGGFSEYAYRTRLLVIRGSIQHPQSFVVDANDVLSGKTPDVRLQPHDIVYVSKRPWWRAEDLLDEAASAFVTSAVVTWTGLHVDTALHR